MGPEWFAIGSGVVAVDEGAPRRGGPPGGGFTPEGLFRFDRNDDGKVSKEELPEFLRERILPRLDANKDGVIDKQEAGSASN